MSFLDRSFELHFNERPFLNHFSYLFITKTTKERSRSQSNFSILCRGNIIPKEVRDKETVSLFLESVDQFERILNDSAFIRLERLTTDEIVGTTSLRKTDRFLRNPSVLDMASCIRRLMWNVSVHSAAE